MPGCNAIPLFFLTARKSFNTHDVSFKHMKWPTEPSELPAECSHANSEWTSQIRRLLLQAVWKPGKSSTLVSHLWFKALCPFSHVRTPERLLFLTKLRWWSTRHILSWHRISQQSTQMQNLKQYTLLILQSEPRSCIKGNRSFLLNKESKFTCSVPSKAPSWTPKRSISK